MLAADHIPVERTKLPPGKPGTDATVARMTQLAMGVYGAKSPKIRALAIKILSDASVPEKNYQAEMVAIHNWVRDNIRYTRDTYGQETLLAPEYMISMKPGSFAGDCLDESTRLLTPQGYKAIKDVVVGDIVQGKNGWTKVTNVWDKGVLPTKTYALDNGGEFIATDDHRCFLMSGAEVRAADLVEGSALLGPSDVTLNDDVPSIFSEQDCYFVGIFLADGWVDANRICVAGKDGFAKEQQKRWVKDYAAGKGWITSWHSRYIRVVVPQNDPMHEMLYSSDTAEGKEVPAEVMASLNKARAKRLLEGLLSDSHHPMHTQRDLDAVDTRKSVRRSGLCYSTISHILAKQVRLLFRLMGYSVRDTLVVDHGGLGTHPVHRIYPRMYRPKPARVEEIEDAGDRHVYDIATEDQGIYLPDADVVVHNCDDKSMLAASLLGAVGIPTRFVVVGVTPQSYSHVYLQAKPRDKWISLDPIMRNHVAGWELPNPAIKKIYPENDSMDGIGNALGYVGDPRMYSFLDPPPSPEEAPANYVKMNSMLDTNQAIDPIMAFPPNQNLPQQMPAYDAMSIAVKGMGAVDHGAMSQRPQSNMQRESLAMSPEGADSIFARPAKLFSGLPVMHFGPRSLATRTPGVPVDVAGLDDVAQTAPILAVPAVQTGQYLGLAVAAVAAYFFFFRK